MDTSIISWLNVKNKYFELSDGEYIHVDKPETRRRVIRIIAEEFPEMPRVKIATTIDRINKMKLESRSYKLYLDLVKNYLNK